MQNNNVTLTQKTPTFISVSCIDDILAFATLFSMLTMASMLAGDVTTSSLLLAVAWFKVSRNSGIDASFRD